MGGSSIFPHFTHQNCVLYRFINLSRQDKCATLAGTQAIGSHTPVSLDRTWLYDEMRMGSTLLNPPVTKAL